MTNQKALRKIRRHRPTSLNEFKDLGLLGRFVGAGVFRESYRIRGTTLIAKFPLDEAPKNKPPCYTCGISHTRTEVARIKKLRAVAVFRPHVPRIWYHDARHGIVVMTYYPKLGGHGGWDRITLLGKVIRKLLRKVAHVQMNDIHGDNIRMTAGRYNKRLIFVDLGY
jgi:hypothetical protein